MDRLRQLTWTTLRAALALLALVPLAALLVVAVVWIYARAFVVGLAQLASRPPAARPMQTPQPPHFLTRISRRVRRD